MADIQLRPNPVLKSAEAYASGVGNTVPSLIVEVVEDGGNVILFDFDNLDAVDTFLWQLQRGRDSFVVLSAKVDAARARDTLRAVT